MMREILFRGQTRRYGEKVRLNGEKIKSNWAYGGIFPQNGDGDFAIIYQQEPTIEKYPVYADTVGQYTGMKDKNGKRIFEGDILEVDVFKNLNRYKAVWTVEYKERFSQGNGYYFYGKNRRFNTRATQSTIINTHATVIGNIYDNPELLGDEENDSNGT